MVVQGIKMVSRGSINRSIKISHAFNLICHVERRDQNKAAEPTGQLIATSSAKEMRQLMINY